MADGRKGCALAGAVAAGFGVLDGIAAFAGATLVAEAGLEVCDKEDVPNRVKSIAP
jgi:hypothetical protein